MEQWDNELSVELYALGNLMWRRMGEHMRQDGLADVTAMERRGYIRREVVAQDKRMKQLVLTDLGRELNHRLRQCAEDTNREFMEALPPEEGTAFIASMKKIRKKLE